MDSVSSMIQSVASGSVPDSVPSSGYQVGYGGSLTSELGSFSDHLRRAEAVTDSSSSAASSPIARSLVEPLDRINSEAQSLADYAKEATVSGNEMTASEIVMLTVRSQEFLFHAQLTANVANRTSDGLQQLFRQQG